MVDDYIEETNNHVLYRVTPVFEGNNLLVSTGKRYHLDPDCGGKNSRATTLDSAISSGLTPCQKCAM